MQLNGANGMAACLDCSPNHTSSTPLSSSFARNGRYLIITLTRSLTSVSSSTSRRPSVSGYVSSALVSIRRTAENFYHFTLDYCILQIWHASLTLKPLH